MVWTPRNLFFLAGVQCCRNGMGLRVGPGSLGQHSCRMTKTPLKFFERAFWRPSKRIAGNFLREIFEGHILRAIF